MLAESAVSRQGGYAAKTKKPRYAPDGIQSGIHACWNDVVGCPVIPAAVCIVTPPPPPAPLVVVSSLRNGLCVRLRTTTSVLCNAAASLVSCI